MFANTGTGVSQNSFRERVFRVGTLNLARAYFYREVGGWGEGEPAWGGAAVGGGG